MSCHVLDGLNSMCDPMSHMYSDILVIYWTVHTMEPNTNWCLCNVFPLKARELLARLEAQTLMPTLITICVINPVCVKHAD